jgi:hypothetical protein
MTFIVTINEVGQASSPRSLLGQLQRGRDTPHVSGYQEIANIARATAHTNCMAAERGWI